MHIFVKIPDKLKSQISDAYLILLRSFFLSWQRCLLFEGGAYNYANWRNSLNNDIALDFTLRV